MAPTAAGATAKVAQRAARPLAPTRIAPRRRRVWPGGAMALLYSAEEPERLRGPQHDAAWADELAAWSHGQETWDQLQFGLRLGDDPRVLVTTTPKPIRLIRDLAAAPTTRLSRVMKPLLRSVGRKEGS